MERRKISTHTPNEERVGYSRAIIVNDKTMYLSGTTAVNEKGETAGQTLFEQTDYIFGKIRTVLKEGGFSPEHIVLVRAYLVNMKDAGEFDKAFIKHFSRVNPCCTLGVSELVNTDLLIEIECVAEKD